MTERMSRNAVFLSTNGGQIDFVQDGEVLASVAIPAGRVPVVDYIDLVPDGAEIEVSHGLAVLEPRAKIRSGTQAYGDGSHASGANPDFQPTSASRHEQQMRLQMAQLQADSARLEARFRALASVEMIPKAPAPTVQPAPEGEGVVVE